jgi:hypothetical protein
MAYSPLRLLEIDHGGHMSILLSPFYSEFESEEEAESYDRWFRAKVQAALDDPRPDIPHEEAMVRLDQLLEEKRKNRRTAA